MEVAQAAKAPKNLAAPEEQQKHDRNAACR
jgi:hypothetical protein